MDTTRHAVVNELVTKWGWSAETLAIWERAGFRCEYCGTDLLRSVDDYFFNAQLDHIVPESRGGKTEPENLALACKTCNFLKRDAVFDPGQGPPPRTLVPRIATAIRLLRSRKQSDLAAIRSLTDQLS
jgi:5-methylcytosine-specific restriction endonuclease McrA